MEHWWWTQTANASCINPPIGTRLALGHFPFLSFLSPCAWRLVNAAGVIREFTRCKFCTEAPCRRFERAADADCSAPSSASFGLAPHDPRRDRLDSARLSARCPHHFALVDAVGIQIINYEGPMEFRHVPPKQFNMAWFHRVLLDLWEVWVTLDLQISSL